mmetsp:Transcript_4375/g.5841  ORF Transcript_4375/g.5841 Transcript_4375/m.5841 type:complete len:363 (-) Transcript_4375:318-1406(-)
MNSNGFVSYETTEGGAARVWGYLENYKSKNSLATGHDRKVIAIDFRFTGSPGNHPSSAGVKTGGGPKKADWRYYKLTSGHMEVIEGTNAGTVMEVREAAGTPYMQLGDGANHIDSSFGLSSWYEWSVKGTGRWTHGDINMDILECEECEYNTDCGSRTVGNVCAPQQCNTDTNTCVAGPAVKLVRRAQIKDSSFHAFYTGFASASSPLGSYKSFRFLGDRGYVSYDTAEGSEFRVWGYLENYKSKKSLATGNARKVISIDFTFTGTPGNVYNTATGVKTGGGHRKDSWRYYRLKHGMIEVVEGTNAGAKLEIREMPNAAYMQLGDGANDKDSSYGFSSWFQWRAIGTDKWYQADFNMDILSC